LLDSLLQEYFQIEVTHNDRAEKFIMVSFSVISCQ